jgi:mannose-6-phosphate isomerase-like protein (cupin superfamily)
MPPGTFEIRHFHQKSQQFFYILRGFARIELQGKQFLLSEQDGLEIPPKTPHQIFNDSNIDLEFLLVSQPSNCHVPGKRVQVRPYISSSTEKHGLIFQ